MFKTLDVDGKEYSIRLTARNAITLEQKLGKHPLMVLMSLEDGQLPSTSDICTILFYGLLSLNSGIKQEDVYDIYDKMIDAGMDYSAIINTLVDVFKSGGFIPEEAVEEDAKNA